MGNKCPKSILGEKANKKGEAGGERLHAEEPGDSAEGRAQPRGKYRNSQIDVPMPRVLGKSASDWNMIFQRKYKEIEEVLQLMNNVKSPEEQKIRVCV